PLSLATHLAPTGIASLPLHDALPIWYGDAGEALVTHGDVNKVAFTGSTAVGKAIARSVAGTDKKVTLELGGKGANIVFDDAPIRSEEHSLNSSHVKISYAVFCLKKKR